MLVTSIFSFSHIVNEMKESCSVVKYRAGDPILTKGLVSVGVSLHKALQSPSLALK